MSVQDVIKKSIVESEVYTNFDVGEIVIALIFSVLLGCFIYLVYKKYYAGVIYSRSFAVTLVGMTIMTCMITLAISTNVVISLGMVGALSIVRFRTAVKDPLDLLYLFWAITVGITSGANMYILALICSLLMLVVIHVFYHKQSDGTIYVAIIHYEGDSVGDNIIQALGKTKYYIKSKTSRGETVELALEVSIKKNDFTFEEKIKEIDGVKDITLIQYNGEYHG